MDTLTEMLNVVILLSICWVIAFVATRFNKDDDLDDEEDK